MDKRFFNTRSIIVSLSLLVILTLGFLLLTMHVSDSVERESDRIVRDAIIRALIACYAAEGSYPASLSYLEQHYGVVIDYDKYIINYGVFASNVVPEVTLRKRK